MHRILIAFFWASGVHLLFHQTGFAGDLPGNNPNQGEIFAGSTSVDPCLAVTTTADGGPGSLRAAIICANNTPGPDTIVLPPGVYTLTIPGQEEDAAATGDLDITDSLTILGAGATNTIIDGNHLDRIFEVLSGTNHLALSGLTLRHGQAEENGSGGAIASGSMGDIIIDHCVINDNASPQSGGGIFVLRGNGNLTVTDSTFANNQSGDSRDGGAIFYDSPAGALSVTRCRFENNAASGDGGAIEFIPPNATGTRLFTITDSLFINNRSGTGSSGGEGGAVYVCCSTVATAITGSTFTGNSTADDGGAIYACCTGSTLISITNSTFSTNSAAKTSGGAIEAEGPVTLVNVTLSGNTAPQGGAIWNDDDGSVTLLNTLIANSQANNLAGQTFLSLGHNLSSDNSGSAWLTASGDRNNTDPGLGPLSDNGGPTPTHALFCGSPAIDAGENNGAPGVDQRGVKRPLGATVDIGAVEASFSSLAVTTTADGGPGSLRAAIICANSSPGPDTITLPAGTYTLTLSGANEDAAATGDLDITDSLTIVGAGATTTIIDGNHLDRIFDIRPGTNHLALSGLTLRHGQSEARASGGAIRSDATGHLTIDHCLISDNRSGSAGGALYLSGNGRLTLTDTKLANNQSGEGDDGGGIFFYDSAIGGLEVTRCRFENNVTPSSGGGAIAFVSLSPGDSGIFKITESVFNNNQSGPGTTGGAGGALYVLVRTGAATIVGTTFSGNTSGGDGGAIYNRGTNIIIGSTFTGNSAVGGDGGAINTCCNSSSLVALTNSTLSANSSSHSGGAIQAEGPVTMVNVTFAGNTAPKGGTIWNDNDRTVLFLNTIIASSSTNNLAGGTFVSLGHNLSSDNSGSAWLTAPGDRNNTEPRLGPLSDNGGPTQTHALLGGSPAIDAGETNGAPGVDQRGVLRPQGAGVDIGAFEASGITFNRQTGLFEQTFRFNNLSGSDMSALRLNITGLPADVAVYNASGSDEGGVFVQYNLPIPANGSVDFVIEFYRRSRQLFSSPAYAAQVVSPASPSAPAGEILALDRQPLLVNGRLLIEFRSIPGRRYSIQYSSDLNDWKAATPVVRAAGNRVQWLDNGPPKTESNPSEAGARFYRVVLLP